MANNDELREHSYDGIQEYDNDLPRWWVWLFVITVALAVVYPFIYDFGPAAFDSETIDGEMAAMRAARQSPGPSSATTDSVGLLALARSEPALLEGKQIYATRCMPCHGDQGQGIVGPNLTDDHWIHGGTIADVQRVVVEGVPDKGMLAWRDQLSPQQIDSVVAFVWSLHGSNPPNPKAPQGLVVVRP